MSKRHDSLLFMVLYREALDRLCVRLNVYLVIDIIIFITQNTIGDATDLPLDKTKRAHQVAAWLQLYVLVILGTDLTELKRRPHLTVKFVLFLGHGDVILRHIGDE